MTRQALTKTDWQANRETIPVAVGLAIAAFRVSVLPRVWILLTAAILIDKAVSSLIGLHRQTIARDWASVLARQLPASLTDLFDKVWIGPLGLAAPVLDSFAPDSISQAFANLIGTFLTFVVWGVFGGAICSIALARMTQEPMPGVGEALAESSRRWRTIWGTPAVLASLVVVLVACLTCGALVMRLPVVGPWLAWIVLPMSIVPASILLLTLSGTALGWPMALGATMSEKSDVFETLSRSFCYLFQAPVTWALTVKVGVIVQTVGYFIVRWFFRGLIAVLERVSTFGGLAGDDRSHAGAMPLPDPWAGMSFSPDAFATWADLLRLATVSWPIGFQFCFAAAMYLALRLRVDRVPIEKAGKAGPISEEPPGIGSEPLELLGE